MAFPVPSFSTTTPTIPVANMLSEPIVAVSKSKSAIEVLQSKKTGVAATIAFALGGMELTDLM